VSTRLVRWTCPNDLHPGALAPGRPRKDDMRRYCIACSEKSGRLTERVAPKLEAKREKAKVKAHAKATVRRAKKIAHQTQADLATRFKCGVDATGAMLYKPIVLIEVRASTGPRAAKITDKRIVLYDHDGLDKYDVRGMCVVAELRRYRRSASVQALKTFIRQCCEQTLGIRPRLENLAEAGDEIAGLLRARDAVEKLGHNMDRGMTRTGT
jgi:hypothetical protein